MATIKAEVKLNFRLAVLQNSYTLWAGNQKRFCKFGGGTTGEVNAVRR